MSPALYLQLLGKFSLNGDDTPLTTVKSPRLQSLLTYLILHRQAPQARRHLAFCLCPDLPEARARANLRKQLHYLTRRGDLAQAQVQVEEILSALTARALNEADEVELICLICYRVLCASRDSRATHVLKTAYDFLQARAAQLPNEDVCHTFLENDPIRREIVQAWNSTA